MKLRILGFLIAVMMLFSLTACGGGSSSASGNEAEDTVEETEAEAEDETGAETEDETEAVSEGYDEDEESYEYYTGEEAAETEEAAPAATEETASDETEEAAPAETEETASDDPYEKMKQVYTKAGAGQGTDGYYYFLAYDENVDNAAFVLLDETGSQSMNVVGPVTQNENLLTIQDTNNEDVSLSFGISGFSDEGFGMVLKNGEEIQMYFTDPGKVIDLFKAIDNGTEIVNPLQ